MKTTVKKLAAALKIDSQEVYGLLKFLVAVGFAKEVGKERAPGVKNGAGATVYEIDVDLTESRIGAMLRSAKE